MYSLKFVPSLLSAFTLPAFLPVVCAAQDAPKPPSLQQQDAAKLFSLGCEAAREGDKKAAGAYLQKAAELGHPKAELTYGTWCFAEHMYRQALFYLLPVAQEQDAQALFCLGYLYYKGWGVPCDQERAYGLFSAAAQQGFPQACTLQALMLLEGKATSPNPTEAAALLNTALHADETPDSADDTQPTDEEDDTTEEEDDTTDEGEDAADEGEDLAEDIMNLCDLHIPSPERVLGLMTLRGVGVPEAHEIAFTLLVNSANKGDTDEVTAHVVSTLYRRGIGIAANERTALEWEMRVSDETRERTAPLLEAYLQAETPEAARELLLKLLQAPHESNAEKEQLVQQIMALPPYTLHEAERADFREQLDAGNFHQEGNTRYLHISGDGTIGERIFISREQGDLYILLEDWEDGSYEVQHYDTATQSMTPLFHIKKELLRE